MQKQELIHYFMKISLYYEAESLTAPVVKAMIVHTMKDLYGQVGSSVIIDVLKVEVESVNEYRVFLRVPYCEISRVWSALSVAGSYNSKTLLIQVNQISASLLGLASSSREFQF